MKQWNDSHQEACEISRQADCAYIHPFDDPIIWQGHASIMQEIKDDNIKYYE